MYRRILVAIDGSFHAEAAARYATHLAGACNAELYVVYVGGSLAGRDSLDRLVWHAESEGIVVHGVVETGDIVPGDLMMLSPGDKIPADARVIEQYGLRVNNAPLTGESKSVMRTADPAFEDEFIENPNLVFGGTGVTAGFGKAVVFATGASTEFGKIAHLTQTVLPEPTPLQREIAVIMGICFFILGGMLDTPFWVRFSFAIGIIVAMFRKGCFQQSRSRLRWAASGWQRGMRLSKT